MLIGNGSRRSLRKTTRDRGAQFKRVTDASTSPVLVREVPVCTENHPSTLDQTTANQERELRAVAERMGCEIVRRPPAPLAADRLKRYLLVQPPSHAGDAELSGGRAQGNNVTESPPIVRQDACSIGEFMVSLPLARLRNDLRKSLI
jgi:hypothetical protein